MTLPIHGISLPTACGNIADADRVDVNHLAKPLGARVEGVMAKESPNIFR
jgi:hypothetical protein